MYLEPLLFTKCMGLLEKIIALSLILTIKNHSERGACLLLWLLLVQILDVGGVFVFDELGSSIHPFMSREIVALFQNKETNPKGAQLIFCSHETYLLSNLVGLRQDQIWFTEKNAQEETVLRSLLEYNMRSDSEFEKNYRQGRFGAVPVIWS